MNFSSLHNSINLNWAILQTCKERLWSCSSNLTVTSAMVYLLSSSVCTVVGGSLFFPPPFEVLANTSILYSVFLFESCQRYFPRWSIHYLVLLWIAFRSSLVINSVTQYNSVFISIRHFAPLYQNAGRTQAACRDVDWRSAWPWKVF